jgi:hypothetical protein
LIAAQDKENVIGAVLMTPLPMAGTTAAATAVLGEAGAAMSKVF